MSVKWAKNLPVFSNLPFRDQVRNQTSLEISRCHGEGGNEEKVSDGRSVSPPGDPAGGGVERALPALRHPVVSAAGELSAALPA